MLRRLVASASIIVLSLAIVPVSANHPQPAHGDVVVFDHKTGNEWWVEAVLSGGASGSVASVQAMDTGGPWVTLTKRSWGAWAASFHIEPGHQVRFRASWTGGDMVDSCWFDHPSGQERCPTTADWRATRIGDTDPSHGAPRDIAVNDADRDGLNEVVVPNANGLWHFEWSARGWLRQMPISDLTEFGRVAVGDVEGDGHKEVYASRGGVVHRFDRDGHGWRSQVVADFGDTQGVGSMSMGDIEDDGLRELYVGIMALDGPVYRIHFDGHEWRSMEIARISGGTDSMWFGDGNNDGGVELYVGEGWRGLDDVWQVDGRPGAWEQTRIAELELGTGVSGIVVGDGDRNGRREVYATARHPSAPLFRIQLGASGWQMERVATLSSSATDLAFADGENDGFPELYAPASDGHVYQVTGRSTGYVVEDLVATGDPHLSTIAMGDGDNDGKVEAYVVGVDSSACCLSHNVYQVANHPIPRPPDAPFEATFTLVRGNEWWVQAQVTPDFGHTVAAVHVALDGGEWRPLQKMSWGVRQWAASYHVPDGTKVQLRATDTMGAMDLSDSCHRWIPPSGQDAQEIPCEPSFDATFRNVRGNDWWVEVDVTANEPLAGVDARVGCDADGWRPLSLRSWGSWAASFHVPPGSLVDFRARAANGLEDVSDNAYVWPQVTPTESCEAASWPRQGSFAAYTLHGVDEGPGSPIRRTSDATMRITFDGAEWSGTCTGTTLEEDSSTGTSRRFDWTAEVPEGPPSSSRSPTVGSTFPVHPFVPSGFGGCGHTEEVIQVTGKGMVDTHMRHADGRTVSLMAWVGEEPPGESGHHDTWVAWETRLGLLVEWAHGGHAGSYTGSMTDTDAPVR